jgi:YlzJ-like protein
MIIYSVIPSEIIYQGMESFDPHYEEMDMDGVKLQVERLNQYQAAIVRLISYNPQDYLNPKFAPGTLITYNPILKTTQN